MKRDIIWTARFKRDYKMSMNHHLDIELLDDTIRALSRGKMLPKKRPWADVHTGLQRNVQCDLFVK